MRSLLVFNFKVSVWVAVIGGGALFCSTAIGFPESLDHLGGYKNQTLVAEAIFPVVALFLWFALYRHEEGHASAFIYGFFVLIPVTGGLISQTINHVDFGRNEQWFLSYVGISHLLFSCLNLREVVDVLGRHE